MRCNCNDSIDSRDAWNYGHTVDEDPSIHYYRGRPAYGARSGYVARPYVGRPGYVAPTVTPGYVAPTVTPGYVAPTVTPGYVAPTVTPGYVAPTVTPGYVGRPGYVGGPVNRIGPRR